MKHNFEELMTLGDLIDFLEGVKDPDKSVVTSGGTYVSGFSSYRGDYAELAITPSAGYSDESSILDSSALLRAAKAADGETFEGWKGGSYMMSRDNPLWIAHNGQCPGIGLDRIEETKWYVVLFGKMTSDS